jgi:hypothetical protein
MSNYHSFGGMKFVPELSGEFETLKKILYSHPRLETFKYVLDKLLPLVDIEIFKMEKPYTQINFPHL